MHGTILSAIENADTPVTVASLLDHMDWMTDRQINEGMAILVVTLSFLTYVVITYRNLSSHSKDGPGEREDLLANIR